jgi:hypothetical protein
MGQAPAHRAADGGGIASALARRARPGRALGPSCRHRPAGASRRSSGVVSTAAPPFLRPLCAAAARESERQPGHGSHPRRGCMTCPPLFRAEGTAPLPWPFMAPTMVLTDCPVRLGHAGQSGHDRARCLGRFRPSTSDSRNFAGTRHHQRYGDWRALGRTSGVFRGDSSGPKRSLEPPCQQHCRRSATPVVAPNSRHKALGKRVSGPQRRRLLSPQAGWARAVVLVVRGADDDDGDTLGPDSAPPPGGNDDAGRSASLQSRTRGPPSTRRVPSRDALHSTGRATPAGRPDQHRWLGSPLERFRLDGLGPKYHKLGHRVAYTREDLVARADSCRRASTSGVSASRDARDTIRGAAMGVGGPR